MNVSHITQGDLQELLDHLISIHSHMQVPQVAQVYNHLLCQFLFLHVLEEKLIAAWYSIHSFIIMNYENTFRITALSFTTVLDKRRKVK
jgi:hypothetical protein